MNVRLYEGGPVHGAGKSVTTCGVNRLYARDWIPTDDPITCGSCARRLSEREAKETTELAL
jgi:hypothetical protein